MLVVARIAGGDLAAPVQRQAHGLELALHRLDVGIGPVARIDLVVARGVFGRQAEGVPAHRMQHVAAHGAAEARHHVAHRIVAHMAHMDAARRIREHLQHVIFRARIIVRDREKLSLVPGFLPAGFGRARIVSFGCHYGINRFRRMRVTFTTLCRNRQLRRALNLGKTGNPAWTGQSVELGKVKANIAAAEQAAGRADRRGHAGRRHQDVRGDGDPTGDRSRAACVRREPGAGSGRQMASAEGRIPRYRAAPDRAAAVQQGQAGGGAVRRHRDCRSRQDRRRACQGDRTGKAGRRASTFRSTPVPSRRRQASSRARRWPSSRAAATCTGCRSTG